MIWYFCLLVCQLIVFCQCGEQLACNKKASAKTTMMRLKLDLLCGYDKYLRPAPHPSNKTMVLVAIAPQVIDFDDTTSTLRMKTLLGMNWEDDNLSWDREQYDNIERIVLDTSMVWVPDLSVYNTNVQSDKTFGQIHAPVFVYRGDVYCPVFPVFTTHCVPDWTNWPRDVHECTLTLGSRQYLDNTIDFSFLYRNGLSLNYLLPNREWELVKANTSRSKVQVGPRNVTDGLSLVTLNFVFTLRRHASVQVASYLMPGVIIIFMSLGLLWIPPQHSERTVILCTLVVVQCISLQYISYKIPSNGVTTPYLVCFYRDCLFLTGLLVLQTIITRNMITCTLNPSYLQSTFRFVAGKKVVKLILVNDLDPKNAAKLMDTRNDEDSALVTSDQIAQQWHMFVNLINRVCFMVLVPVYLLLSVSLMPVNYSFSPN